MGGGGFGQPGVMPKKQNCSRQDTQLVYWQRINPNGVAPQDLFSWKKSNDHPTQYEIYTSLITKCYNEWIDNLLLILLDHIPNGFLFAPHYVSPISTGFQLIFPSPIVGPGPALLSPSPILLCRLVPGSPGSRQLPVFLSGTRIFKGNSWQLQHKTITAYFSLRLTSKHTAR